MTVVVPGPARASDARRLRYRGGLTVKLGGAALANLREEWWDDLVTLAARPLLIVHGWSVQLSDYRRARGRTTEYLVDKHGHRSRFTDREVLEDIAVVAADVREQIAGRLVRRGLTVAREAGDARSLLRAEVRPNLWWQGSRLERLTNLVGPVRAVDTELLGELARDCDAVVISPLASAPGYPRVNTDGDRAAARLAAALGADRLVLVTDVPGVLEGEQPIRRLAPGQALDLARTVRGGMRKKLIAAHEAASDGVASVHIGQGAVSSIIAGAGTVIA